MRDRGSPDNRREQDRLRRLENLRASEIPIDEIAGLSALDVQTALEEILAGSSGVADGDKGDIVVSSGGTVWTLDGAITASIAAKADDAATTAALATKLDTASYTAADVLAKLLTVDGAGSGLDADTLDGVSSAAFALLAGGTFTGDISVPDEAYGVGWNASLEVPTKNAVYDKIEAVVAAGAFSGALVKKAATLTAQNVVALTVVTWDTEVYDVGGWHSTSVNTSRHTVPAGVSRVRLSAVVRIDNVAAADFMLVYIAKNGAITPGLPQELWEPGYTGPWFSLAGAVVECVPGDYFEVTIRVEADTSVDIHSQSWFAIEAVV